MSPSPVCLLTILLLGLAQAAFSQEALPEAYRLEEAPCFLDDCAGMEADPTVRFYHLEVPLDWERPEGPSTRLAALHLRALRPDTLADPVIFLPGGPGGSFLRYAEGWRSHPLRGIRDLVILDFRGTGFSEPNLCPELNERWWQLYSADLEGEELIDRATEAFGECLNALEPTLDLSTFSTRHTVRDLEALRQALGFGPWNLFGVSYGTHVAQIYQRTFPEQVRSMILDSPLPLNYNYLADRYDTYHRALELLFSTCTQDPQCSRRFPNLEETFYENLETLRTTPLRVAVPRDLPGSRTFTVNFADLHAGVFNVMYDPRGYAIIPLLTEALGKRDELVFRRLITMLYEQNDRLSQGNYLLVQQNDEVLLPDRRQQEGLSDPGYPRLKEALAIDMAREIALRRTSRARSDSIPVYGSDPSVPVLIFSGRLDPITPPAYGQRTASLYPNSVYVSFPGQGHGVASTRNACAQSIAQAFILRPGDRSALTCVTEAEEGIPFVTDIYDNSRVAGLLERLEQRHLFTVIWLGASLLLLLSGLLWWPITWVYRKMRSTLQPHPVAAKFARWVMAANGLGVLAFIGLLSHYTTQTLAGNPYTFVFGLVPGARLLPVVSWALFAGVALGVLFAASAWLFVWWKRGARIHYTLVVLGGVLFCLLLLRYHLF